MRQHALGLLREARDESSILNCYLGLERRTNRDAIVANHDDALHALVRVDALEGIFHSSCSSLRETKVATNKKVVKKRSGKEARQSFRARVVTIGRVLGQERRLGDRIGERGVGLRLAVPRTGKVPTIFEPYSASVFCLTAPLVFPSDPDRQYLSKSKTPLI